MEFTAGNINKFLLFKLPSAFICGVRIKKIDGETCTVHVRHQWINQNPFKSMYFAVQAMAAELSTGALVMYHVKKSGNNISMLVASSKAHFTKKALGKITFTCGDGASIEKSIKIALHSRQGQTCVMTSVGTNENGEVVSTFTFEWTIKTK